MLICFSMFLLFIFRQTYNMHTYNFVYWSVTDDSPKKVEAETLPGGIG